MTAVSKAMIKGKNEKQLFRPAAACGRPPILAVCSLGALESSVPDSTGLCAWALPSEEPSLPITISPYVLLSNFESFRVQQGGGNYTVIGPGDL